MKKIENIINSINKYVKIDDLEIENTYNYIKEKYDSNLLDEVLETTLILTSIYADIETIISSLIYKLLSNNIVELKDLEKK